MNIQGIIPAAYRGRCAARRALAWHTSHAWPTLHAWHTEHMSHAWHTGHISHAWHTGHKSHAWHTGHTSFAAHTATCPAGARGEGGEGPVRRASAPGKVRLGFIPDEWFNFFYTKTGVTGSYLFGIMLVNYLFSKEKFVMEHEYYSGLSIFLMVYYGTKLMGPSVGAFLDKEVEEVEGRFKATRRAEETHYENIIKGAKDSQMRAHGQKMLMDAKKENVAMQLEAAYRERMMHVYKTVKRRLDYLTKRHRVETQIQQKWMTTWILNNVLKAITPDIEKKAIEQAIADLTAIANKVKK